MGEGKIPLNIRLHSCINGYHGPCCHTLPPELEIKGSFVSWGRSLIRLFFRMLLLKNKAKDIPCVGFWGYIPNTGPHTVFIRGVTRNQMYTSTHTKLEAIWTHTDAQFFTSRLRLFEFSSGECQLVMTWNDKHNKELVIWRPSLVIRKTKYFSPVQWKDENPDDFFKYNFLI